MGAPAVAGDEFDLELTSGRLHAQRYGSRQAPLVLGVPGLSANLRSFAFLGERLGGEACQLVALDLRGRGRSDVTAAGSYGWPNHARDVLEAATALGAQSFKLIGHSMGAFVAMQAAQASAARLERVVLVDAAGVPEPAAVTFIMQAVDRLGRRYPSVEDLLARVKGIGTVEPWSAYWEDYFRYELVESDGGVRVRTDRAAVLEDLSYGVAHDPHQLWPALTMPVLLLRAALPLGVGNGFILSAADRDAFAQGSGQRQVVEVPANHYGIITHEATAAAVKAFLVTGA
jgi:pimeloyl-ACP methyl ester carboxylesterase